MEHMAEIRRRYFETFAKSQVILVSMQCCVNQHQIFAAFENIIFKYEIYYLYRTMEYEFMLKILMLIPGKFSTPIDTSGIQHLNKKVRFFSAIDLANSLEQEKSTGKQGSLALRLLQVDLVILDKLGYLTLSQDRGALLFHLLSRL